MRAGVGVYTKISIDKVHDLDQTPVFRTTIKKKEKTDTSDILLKQTHLYNKNRLT